MSPKLQVKLEHAGEVGVGMGEGVCVGVGLTGLRAGGEGNRGKGRGEMGKGEGQNFINCTLMNSVGANELKDATRCNKM